MNTLQQTVKTEVDNYFSLLKGKNPKNVYRRFVDEVEAPLMESLMERTRGNQSEAAKISGLNRGTLRKKLKKHGLL